VGKRKKRKSIKIRGRATVRCLVPKIAEELGSPPPTGKLKGRKSRKSQKQGFGCFWGDENQQRTWKGRPEKKTLMEKNNSTNSKPKRKVAKLEKKKKFSHQNRILGTGAKRQKTDRMWKSKKGRKYLVTGREESFWRKEPKERRERPETAGGKKHAQRSSKD